MASITVDLLGVTSESHHRDATISGSSGGRNLGSFRQRKAQFVLYEGETQFRLNVVVPSPSWSSTADPFLLEQDFVLQATAGRPQTLVPTYWRKPGGPSKAGLHPRLRPGAGSTAGASAPVAHYTVDLQFIDVTAHVDLGDLRDPLAVTNGRRPSSTVTLAYQQTSSPKNQCIWLVSIPTQHVTSSSKLFHFVMFLRPSTDKYTDPSALGNTIANASRYLLRHPKLGGREAAPFFIRNPTNNPAAMANPVDTAEWYNNAAPCGFLHQLVMAGKPIVFITPTGPKAWGAVRGGVDFRGLMMSLRRALFGDGHVASGVDRLAGEAQVRTGLGSFSFAATAAQQILEGDPDGIDEFYWFDPQTQVANNANAGMLGNWAKGKAPNQRDRRLRLIGGLNCQRFSQIATQIDSMGLPQGAFKNLIAEDHFETAKSYEHAVAVPVCNNTGDFPEVISGPGAPTGPANIAALSALSRDLRIVIDPPGRRQQCVLRQRDANNQNLSLTERTTATLEEIAGFARFQYMNVQHKGPLGHGTATLSDLITEITKNVLSSVRHQWSVVGGDYSETAPTMPTRDSNFVGFLQACLQEGLF